jgi:PleD family two-component response regulator
VGYLRELGFVIEMDDFGSGYSSLNMLGKMPVDILKLDMKFIQDEAAGPDDGGILHFIMELARWMDLSVVAEGVETRQQLERLKKADCDYVQGYYFARPMPINEFEELLRDGHTAMEQEGMGDENLRESQPFPVLLVADEDACYRRNVRETFEGSFQVMEAGDGKAALRCMADSKSRIAAVILSLTLSGTDGFSVLEVLQREKMDPDIPVIATGPQNEAMEDRAMELGADDFAGRPHSQKSLRRRVLRAIHAKAPRERAARPGQILTLGED